MATRYLMEVGHENPRCLPSLSLPSISSLHPLLSLMKALQDVQFVPSDSCVLKPFLPAKPAGIKHPDGWDGVRIVDNGIP